MEKGKLIDKEWNDNNLNSLINDCIDIENNIKKIKEINKINENINKLKSNYNNIEIEYILEEDKINNLLEEIKNLGKIFSRYSYNKFNINLKIPIHILDNHTNEVVSLIVMKDGRLVSCSWDYSIIIYNKITYKPDLTIKEHKNYVLSIIELSSGFLASCSSDKTIIIYKIKGNGYEIIQTLNYHSRGILKIIEIKNKTLVSCSHDKTIIFYIQDNMEYKKDYQISTDGRCYSIIQTKDNEICYSEENNSKICFYDLLERKNKSSISNISKYNEYRECFIMITKDLLAIPGQNKISIINVNEYQIIRIIDVPNSGWICGICKLNNNMLLTGDSSDIRQWKIEKDNLILLSKKENAHDGCILSLLKLENGNIVSSSGDHKIKIW